MSTLFGFLTKPVVLIIFAAFSKGVGGIFIVQHITSEIKLSLYFFYYHNIFKIEKFLLLIWQLNRRVVSFLHYLKYTPIRIQN